MSPPSAPRLASAYRDPPADAIVPVRFRASLRALVGAGVVGACPALFAAGPLCERGMVVQGLLAGLAIMSAFVGATGATIDTRMSSARLSTWRAGRRVEVDWHDIDTIAVAPTSRSLVLRTRVGATITLPLDCFECPRDVVDTLRRRLPRCFAGTELRVTPPRIVNDAFAIRRRASHSMFVAFRTTVFAAPFAAVAGLHAGAPAAATIAVCFLDFAALHEVARQRALAFSIAGVQALAGLRRRSLRWTDLERVSVRNAALVFTDVRGESIEVPLGDLEDLGEVIAVIRLHALHLRAPPWSWPFHVDFARVRRPSSG